MSARDRGHPAGRVARWAIVGAAALPVPACATAPSSPDPPASAASSAVQLQDRGASAGAASQSPRAATGAIGDAGVTVGGGFWSPRLASVARAIAKCGTDARDAAAPITERALFDALASLSLDGSSLRPDMPATCSATCTRPVWNGGDPRGCASLAALASLERAVWRVEGDGEPVVTAALMADSELSFTVGGIRWHIGQNTDYPWSGHVGFELSHRAPQVAEGAEPMPAERALGVRVQLPDWLDPASVRVSARGRMLAAGDYTMDGRMLTVRGPWTDGDRMHVSFPMPPRRVAGADGTEVWRGPLRYVAEATDQPGGALADMTIAPGDGLREVPYVLGVVSDADAPARQGEPMTQRPTPQPDAVANSAPNGIMAVMVERRARGLPDLVLVPLAFAGNRGDMPRVGTFAAPGP